ncbi:MAG TPA: hypothetical protein PLP29_16570 [Candidatus Ozemobacteraceae bacterium]|nr:hypothetical protein [Candidatus Ozemobacteraceae bacterium]
MTTNAAGQETNGNELGQRPEALFHDEPAPPPHEPGNGGDGDDGGSWKKWLRLIIDANPLYLLSVLLMIGGLYLIGSAASERVVQVDTVAGFFGIQNVYEIVLVAMAIYLLRTGTNSRHGKLLLIFVMVFLADLTFYQVRIATMDPTWGFVIGLLYLALGAAKVGAVLYWLEIRPRWELLVYPFFSFGMIYFAPQYLYWVLDKVGVGHTGTPFSGQAEVYMIWLLAALIQLPVIVSCWRRSGLETPEPNAAFGDATTLYRALLLFPFVALPFQLEKNVMADAVAGNGAIGSLSFVYVPYLLAGAFFVQSFFRNWITKLYTVNAFDAVILMSLTLLALLTERSDAAASGLTNINWYIIIGAHLAVALTRRNLVSASFLGLVVLRHVGVGVKTAAADAYEYGRNLSTTAWAALLMAGSFISLGLGFLVSLGSKDPRKS